MEEKLDGVIITDGWKHLEQIRLEEEYKRQSAERLNQFKRRLQTMEAELEKGYTGK